MNLKRVKTGIQINVFLLIISTLMTACSGSDSSTDSSIKGTLAASSTKIGNFGPTSITPGTVTHIMAVSPSTSNPRRYVAAVKSDNTFSLSLSSGVPYIIVFVAQNGDLVGPDMIVGTVNVSANGLDTLPIAQAADLDLGEVDINTSAQTANATISTSVDELEEALGITSDEATYIGGLDDLALRLANPDVDGNGIIDALEDKKFSLDWHVRADTKLGGNDLLITDIQDAFQTGLSLQWNLGSAYAVYPRSYDDINYVPNSGTTAVNGGGFLSTGTSEAHTSLSGGIFGDMRQWGPDYNLITGELGSSDAVGTFTYSLSGGKVLTFSNVRTKTVAELNADGVLLPFIKINTTGSGAAETKTITGISYIWKKLSQDSWVNATETEISLLVQKSGAHLNLSTFRQSGDERGLSFSIPSTSANGTINIGDSGSSSVGVSDPSNVTIADICSTALSYDDKMGLRLFAGAPKPHSGTTPCP